MTSDVAYLVLENGIVFRGHALGARGLTIGEAVFTTGMQGYIETLTDPSYWGQIIVQTFPLIGNYGYIPKDVEASKVSALGYVVRDICDEPSNWRSEGTIGDYLAKGGIIGIDNIDTRALTRVLREKGTMNAAIVSGSSKDVVPLIHDIESGNMDTLLVRIKEYRVRDAVSNVTGSSLDISGTEETSSVDSPLVALWDFGAKGNIRREIARRNMRLSVVKANTSAQDILALRPDGVLLSNGPGDPADCKDIVKEVAVVAGAGIPVFGICLGHQLLALSQGARTIKLKYGHRGPNQPVKELATGRVYITSQNHGYAVDSGTLPEVAILSWTNMNDGTCEGVSYSGINASSVQFHPEAAAGPHDTNFLFDTFLKGVSDYHARTTAHDL